MNKATKSKKPSSHKIMGEIPATATVLATAPLKADPYHRAIQAAAQFLVTHHDHDCWEYVTQGPHYTLWRAETNRAQIIIVQEKQT